MKRKLIIIGSLITLFLFGGVCGFAVAVSIVKKTLSEEHFVQHRMAEERQRLQLTPEQITQAQPGYDQLKQELTQVKSDTVIAITAAAIKQATELATILTPAQREVFKQLNEERRARFEKSRKP